MSRHAQIQATAEEFWQRVGQVVPFPRDLELPIMKALPVTIVKLPSLHLTIIERWLRQRKVAYQFPCADRQVRGCLVAYRGQGIIFIDAADHPNEVRLTLAHEATHFLEDYARPRAQAIARLGPAIIPVLDGDRPPAVRERVHAILSSAPIALYYRYMERGKDNDIALSSVWDAEDRADRLALELIAPAELVLDPAALDKPSYQERRKAVVQTLTTTFGLPEDMADWYGRMLLQSAGRGPSFLEQLGLSAF